MVTKEELTERTRDFFAERLRGDRADETLVWVREIARDEFPYAPMEEIVDGVVHRRLYEDVTSYCPWAEKNAKVYLDLCCEIEVAKTPRRCRGCRFRERSLWKARLCVVTRDAADCREETVADAWFALSGEADELVEYIAQIRMSGKR